VFFFVRLAQWTAIVSLNSMNQSVSLVETVGVLLCKAVSFTGIYSKSAGASEVIDISFF
jgi:hypothetical protein